jgi:hypothetical protein
MLDASLVTAAAWLLLRMWRAYIAAKSGMQAVIS